MVDLPELRAMLLSGVVRDAISACEAVADQAFSPEENDNRRSKFLYENIHEKICKFGMAYLNEATHSEVDYIAEADVCFQISRAFVNLSIFFIDQNDSTREIYKENQIDHGNPSEKLFESDVIPLLHKILLKFEDNIEICKVTCQAIRNLCFGHNGFRISFGSLGTCELLSRILIRFSSLPTVVEPCAAAIGALACLRENASRFGEAGTCELLVRLLCDYIDNYSVVLSITYSIAPLCHENDSNQFTCGRAGSCEALLSILEKYIEFKPVSMNTVAAIHELAYCPRNRNTFNDIRILPLMKKAKDLFSDVCYHSYYQTKVLLR